MVTVPKTTQNVRSSFLANKNKEKNKQCLPEAFTASVEKASWLKYVRFPTEL